MPYVIGKLIGEKADSYKMKDGSVKNIKKLYIQEQVDDFEFEVVECSPDFKVEKNTKGEVSVFVKVRAGSFNDGKYITAIPRYTAS